MNLPFRNKFQKQCLGTGRDCGTFSCGTYSAVVFSVYAIYSSQELRKTAFENIRMEFQKRLVFSTSSQQSLERKYIYIWNYSNTLEQYQIIILADGARSIIFLSENRKHCRCSPKTPDLFQILSSVQLSTENFRKGTGFIPGFFFFFFFVVSFVVFQQTKLFLFTEIY